MARVERIESFYKDQMKFEEFEGAILDAQPKRRIEDWMMMIGFEDTLFKTEVMNVEKKDVR